MATITETYMEKNVRELVDVFASGNVFEYILAGKKCVSIRELNDSDF